MQRIKQERKVNIFDLVKQLRKQRMKMVQTFDQYALVYSAALEMTTVRTKKPRGEYIIQHIFLWFYISLFQSLCTLKILNFSRIGHEEETICEMETRFEQRLMIKKVPYDLFLSQVPSSSISSFRAKESNWTEFIFKKPPCSNGRKSKNDWIE